MEKNKHKSKDESDEESIINTYDNDDDDAVCQKTTNRKQIKNENLNSLKILEQITGKQFIRPQEPVDHENQILF